MHAQIEILASLQNIDRDIREKNSKKQRLLAATRDGEERIKVKRSEIASLTGEWAEKDRLRQEKDRILQEEGRKAMEKRMRMNRIKNIKELQALQREIEQIKQANSELEEELIKIFEELDLYTASRKEKEEELKKLEEEWKEKQREMEVEISGIDQAVSEASTLRQTIASQINGDLIERYELIFARRGGTAVVAVSGGICQGCYMNIPPQLWNEIIKSEKINLCPSCHRIFYYKPIAPSDKQV